MEPRIPKYVPVVNVVLTPPQYALYQVITITAPTATPPGAATVAALRDLMKGTTK